MGTYFDVRAEQFTLETSVTEALAHGVSNLCTDSDRASALYEAMLAAGDSYNEGTIVGPVNGILTPAMFPALPDGYSWVAGGHRFLDDIGAKTENVWFDGNSDHYGSNDRSVDIVSIPAGFRMWTVSIDGWGTPPTRYGVGPATDVRVHSVSHVVHPGEYLVGYEFARYGNSGTPDVVAYLGQCNGWGYNQSDASDYYRLGDRESVFYALAESEGWCADRAYAGCDSCEARWEAESGSWRFRPSDAGYDGVPSDLADFDYDDTTGHENNSVVCPHCSTPNGDNEPTGPGRVHFDIY